MMLHKPYTLAPIPYWFILPSNANPPHRPHRLWARHVTNKTLKHCLALASPLYSEKVSSRNFLCQIALHIPLHSFSPPHLPPSLWLSLSSTAQNTDSVLNPGVQHDPLKCTHTRSTLKSGCVTMSSIPRSKLNSISGAQSQKGYDTTDLIHMTLPFEVATTTQPIMHYTTSVDSFWVGKMGMK